MALRISFGDLESFAPTIFPTLGLITGVIGAMAMDQDDERRTVKAFSALRGGHFGLLNLFVPLCTMLLEPYAGSHDMRFYNLSNYWLSPLQGLAVAALGVLFHSKKKTPASDAEEAAPPKPRKKKRLTSLLKRRPKT